MAKHYKVGMVAELLGGKNSPEGKMSSLFASRPDTAPKQHAFTVKDKKVKVLDDTPTIKKSKKRRLQTEEWQEENISTSVKMSKKKDLSSQGFNPPPGIVHEALVGKLKLSRLSNEEEDSDDQGKKRAEKRPRRDRLKKASEKRTVFVGNVPLTQNKKKLIKLFKQFGEVKSVRFRCAPVADPTVKKRVAVITKEFHKQRTNISAFVCFMEAESAKKAIALNNHEIGGHHLRVDLAKPHTKKDTKRSAFVGNLPFAIEEETIREHFEDCGTIANVRVIRDRKTNLGKGFCYILFESKDGVELALKLNKSTLQGREVRVERCSDKKKATQTRKESSARKDKAAVEKQPPQSERKPTKIRNRMWRPTNAPDSKFLQAQKSALEKKMRQAEKRKQKKRKTDEVTKVLGPMQQPPSKSVGNKNPKSMKVRKMKGKS